MPNPRLEVEIGADVKALQSGLGQAQKSIQGFNRELKLIKQPSFSFGVGANARALPVLDRNLKNVTQSYRGANSAAISFSRVIQDAPYGIIGVSNNITQLAEQFTYLKKETGSTKVALKAAFSSLLSPMNLVVLGISAITSAFVFYSMRARKAKSDTEDFADSLNDLDAARLKGSQSAQKEVAELQSLYAITQDTTRSIGERTQAVNTLQEKYPSYLGNMSDESILAGNATSAYRELTGAILGAAQAQAYYDRIAKNASKVIENQFKLIENQPELSKAIAELAEVDRLIEAASGGLSVQGQRQVDALIQKRDRLQGIVDKYAATTTDIATENNKLEAENVRLANQANKAYSEYYKLTEKTAVSTGNIADNSRKNLKWLLSQTRVQQASIAPTPDISTSITPAFESVDNILPNIITEGEKVAMKFNEGFESVFGQGLSDSIGDAFANIGEALAAGDSGIQALGVSLLASFGGIVTRLGKMAIEIGVGMLGIKTALKTLNPAVAIAAGAALVALGSFYSKGASKLGSSIGGGATGQGPDSGSSSFGPTSYSSSFSGGDRTVTFEIAGTKLIGVLRNAGAELQRYGG